MSASKDDDQVKNMRLFIGNISQDLYDEKDQLITRLGKFGKVTSDFEIHQKPTLLNYFGYINIDLTQKEFAKLKAHLNGVKFKNSKLILDVLAPTYKEKWELDQKRPDTKELDRLKRDKIAKVRLERIKLGGKDELVIKGRLRKSSRKNLKNLTMRCYLNGKLIMTPPTNNKTKVWGYDKNKKLRDLTWVFEHQTWKDGSYHIVERNTQLKKVPDAEQHDNEPEKEEEQIFEIEKSTNSKILGELFQNLDFDKPIALNELEDVDESAESEYEFELHFNGLETGKDSYDVKVKKCAVDGEKVIEEYKKHNPLPEVNEKASSDDEDVFEETEDIEMNEAAEVNNDDDDDEDVDEEFMPTFGLAKEPQTEATVNDTEKLRSLFNSGGASSFKLEDSDVDEEQGIEIEQDEILLQQQEKKQLLEVSSLTAKITSLFFSHPESPFLYQQSQLNKVSKDFNKEEYKAWFYEKRGELNREFKRHKRDFVRQFNKKK